MLGLAVVAGLVAVVVRCGYCLVFSLTRITCCLCGDKVTSSCMSRCLQGVSKKRDFLFKLPILRHLVDI